MKDLFSEDRETEDEALRAFRDKRAELSQIQEELRLYQLPLWLYFRDYVAGLIEADTKLLESCSIDEVPVVRARIKAHRHLLGREQELTRLGAELRAQIEAPEDTDE